MKFLYFRNAVEDAAAFPVSALTAIDAADDSVVLQFSNQRDSDNAVNKVTVNCAADKSAILCKEIASAIAGSGSVHNSLIVVADDIDSVYIGEATSCGAIALDYVAAS